MPRKTSTPHITPAVVDYLDELFPDRCPDPDMTIEQVWMAAGAARVVRKLKHVIKTQEETARETIEGA